MKSLLTTLFLAWGVLLSTTQAQQFQEKQLAKFPTDSLMEAVFKDLDIEYKLLKQDIYQIQLKKHKVLANIDDNNLFLYATYSDKPSLNRVNDFNMQYRWARVYLDEDGELMMADELEFEGGIGATQIYSFLNTFSNMLDALVEHMK